MSGPDPLANKRPGHRPVRSFVLRQGRLTSAQQRALEELWPRFGLEADGKDLSFPDLFEREAPVVMEIGFGNGEATWQMAAHQPDHDFLAVEVHQPGVGHLLLRLEEHQINNVRIVCADGVEVLEQQVPDASLTGFRLYFPDPWPKKRHRKRRIVQTPFIDVLSRKLMAGGVLHMATDWAPYAEHMVEVMEQSADFENMADYHPYSKKPEWRPETKYERRGERLGHKVYDLLYKRKAGS